MSPGIGAFISYKQSMPYSGTYKMESDRFGERLNQEQRYLRDQELARKQIEDLALKDRIARLEQERKFDELYELEKQLHEKANPRIARSRYLE